MRPVIGCLGAGRMGRGIAVVFAFAGHQVIVVDFKKREASAFEALAAEARAEIRSTLEILSRIDLLPAELVPAIADRITIVSRQEAGAVLPRCDVIFEGMPEILKLKQVALAEASRLAGESPIIASTTSTILVDDLAGSIEHPGRFLNAHWLNPAYLVPLIELSPGRLTAPDVTARMKTLLEGIGKVPVVCAARPGFIVPRIQSLAMNEAARMVEEGVASAEDIDKAVIYGFGFRFAVLGLLEFIDWGGGDILHHASRYLVEALGDSRYAAPEIIATNMREGPHRHEDRAGLHELRRRRSGRLSREASCGLCGGAAGHGSRARNLSHRGVAASMAAEIGRDQFRVVDQRVRRTGLDDFAGFQHIAVIRGLQRGAGVLLDQQDRYAEAAQRGDGAEDFADDQRSEAETGFVEDKEFGFAISARPSASICRSPPDSVPAACLLRSFSRGKRSNTSSRLLRVVERSRRL